MNRKSSGSQLTLVMFVFVVTALFPFSSSWGQEADSSLLEEAREAYQKLDYQLAESKAREALAQYEQFSLDQISEIHTIIALILYSQNDQAAARQHLEAALRLNPDLELDPLLVSPKILDFLEAVRGQMGLVVTSRQEPGRVSAGDMRANAALRSLLLPGWGQLYKEEHAKGWLLGGIWAISASGAIFAHIQNTRTDPSRPPELWDIDISWRTMRNGLIMSAAGAWVYSYFDALMRSPSSFQLEQRSGSRVLIVPARGSVPVSLTARIVF